MKSITVDGAWAEYMVADPSSLVYVPEGVPFDQAAAHICAGSSIYGSIITAAGAASRRHHHEIPEYYLQGYQARGKLGCDSAARHRVDGAGAEGADSGAGQEMEVRPGRGDEAGVLRGNKQGEKCYNAVGEGSITYSSTNYIAQLIIILD